ncbi:hypothetical protein QT711_12595 [Sporosarcina saromensis]|uniref:Glucan-binding domain-containing protein (YG repeat) n=1 Tax=Sporosarcina saromensis TaxID=359365 RepID=A0ABU4GAM5_9BACL|nr:hypothetical protein [Sporosarcina saromensis]MDW0114027.1 hypothetical protein [Sporosarcina saromensis]
MKKYAPFFSSLLLLVLCFTFYTKEAYANETTLFFEDETVSDFPNAESLLYANDTVVYQFIRDKEYPYKLYKMNVFNHEGNQLGTHTFADHHFFDPHFFSSKPVIDENGYIYISYAVGEEEWLIDKPIYLAKISPTGTTDWTFKTDYFGPVTTLIDTDRTVYFTVNFIRDYHGFGSGYIYSLTKDGVENWNTKFEGDVLQPILYFDENQHLRFNATKFKYEDTSYTVSKSGQIINSIETAQLEDLYQYNDVRYTLTEIVHGEVSLTEKHLTTGQEFSTMLESDSFQYIKGVNSFGDAYVHTTSNPYFTKEYRNRMYSINNGQLNWKRDGYAHYDGKSIFSQYASTTHTISKLDPTNGKAMNTDVLQIAPTSVIVVDDNTFLYADGQSIYKLRFTDDKQTGWKMKNGYLLLYNNDGTVKTGWHKGANSNWYFFDPEGVMKTGWYNLNGKWYYSYHNGSMATGWVVSNDQLYFLNDDGVMQTGWITWHNGLSNNWYFLNDDGARQTGWVKENNKWYFLQDDGAMQTGWVKWNNEWYFLNTDGVMQTGWIKWNNQWYFLTTDGTMQTGWIKWNNQWYFLTTNGVMQTGWTKWNKQWYFLNTSGAMQIGWKLINNNWYYFYYNGKMATNITIDGFKVNHAGVWIP